MTDVNENLAENSIEDVPEIGLSQENMDVLYNYGMQLFSAGSYEKAEELFSGLCLFNVAESKYWHAKGECRAKRGEHHGAYRCFSAASIISPREPQHLLSAALCQMKLSKPEVAQVCLQQVLEMKPEDEAIIKKAELLLQKCLQTA
ncbi:hypothetical protein SG34_032515 [Thalassomonas viridans]|uniref:Uncharacterized protein n=1 Tax=Thalassomonas viridans TaxID=137584 RepID=A0AAE9ZDQ5_9GAMM|nr:hypothetical protein [Thalassomonas viridans]WDE08642.1 hypothetical protein SG34_032515 [Thalassomonas viridans]